MPGVWAAIMPRRRRTARMLFLHIPHADAALRMPRLHARVRQHVARARLPRGQNDRGRRVLLYLARLTLEELARNHRDRASGLLEQKERMRTRETENESEWVYVMERIGQ